MSSRRPYFFFPILFAAAVLLQVLPGSRPAQAEEWTNFYITPRQIYDVAIEKKVCESCDYFQTYVTVWCATPVGVFEVNPNFGNYTRYSYADGLAFNSTKVITVDDDGRKWIGTTRATDTHGLMSCFDGETWTTYRPPGSSIINAITVDQDGAVWLGRGDFFSTMLGYGGINVWDGDNWTVYTTDNSDLVTDYVEAITLDAAGHKWIGTSTVALGVLIEQPGGVNRFDGANWTTFHTNNSDLTGEYVYDIAIDSTGSKWVATLHNGIFRYNDSDWVNYTAADGLPSNEIQALAVDSDDTIWFGTVLNGAGSYDGAALTLYDADNSGLSNNNVHDIAVGEPDDSCANCGSVWFGTGNGLCRLNDNGWTQFPLGGIPAADYREVAVDGAGQAWFAASAGLIRYDGSSWTTFDTANSGLVSEAVSTVAVDDGNNVWAGTDAGLSVYDGSSWTVYDTGSSGLSSNAVSALAVDADDKVWVGTDAGLSVYDGSSWTVYDTGSSGLSSNAVSALAVDADDKVWVGTDAGLSVYDGSSWTVYDTGSSGLASDNVISLAVDDAGRLWAGTDAGLSRYSGGSWTVYDTDNSALVSNDIRSLAADGHGQVWGGTPEGLHRFDGSTWKIYGCGDGVDSGTITGMVVDPAADSVWFARGEAGVSRVDLSAPDQAAAAVNYGDGDSDLLIDTGCFLRTALKDH